MRRPPLTAPPLAQVVHGRGLDIASPAWQIPASVPDLDGDRGAQWRWQRDIPGSIITQVEAGRPRAAGR